MTLKQLLEILEDCPDEVLEMKFVVLNSGTWIEPSICTVVKADTDEESIRYPEGQPIFI